MSKSLQSLRLEAGHTQSSLAAAIGSSASSVSGWEAGQGRPRPKVYPILAEALRVSTETIREAVEQSAADAIAKIET